MLANPTSPSLSLRCCDAARAVHRPLSLQLFAPLSAHHRCCCCCRRRCLCRCPPSFSNAAATMTGIAAASFFSNACKFGGCGLHFDSLSELIVHIEDNHIGKRRYPPSSCPSACSGRGLRLATGAKLGC